MLFLGIDPHAQKGDMFRGWFGEGVCAECSVRCSEST